MADLKRAPEKPRVGAGFCIGHHGEILQGLFRAPDETGRVFYRRGLMTLPCPLLWSRARFTPQAGAGPVKVTPPTKEKARRAAVLTLQHLGLPISGHVEIVSNIPPARGLGSSTADAVAVMRAIADGCQLSLSAGEMARLAVLAETASDAVMFAGERCGPAVLFAQREGCAIEVFSRPLPPLIVLGFDAADVACDARRGGVNTLDLPLPAYTPAEVTAFEHLRALARQAIAAGDARLIGQVATRSAVINQAYLPTPGFEQWLRVRDQAGAVGAQVAHSGTVVGLLFDPCETDPGERICCARRCLLRLGIRRVWRYALA